MPVNEIRHFHPDGSPFLRANEGNEIVPETHYFGVTLNQMNLRAGQEWWVTYDPLVYISVEFRYGAERVTVPKLIGPSVLRGQLPMADTKLAHGFVIKNLRVVGPHPFRGDDITLTVVLYKVKRTDYAKHFLRFAETISGSIGLPAQVDMVIKVGGVVVDALEALFEVSETKAVLGHQIGFNASSLRGLQAQMVGIFDGQNSATGSTSIRVVEDELIAPNSVGNFVLYSLWKSDRRSNEGAASFSDLAAKIRECALSANEEAWTRGKAMLLTLYQQLLSSPDLVRDEAKQLFSNYREEMLALRTQAQDVSLMSVEGRDNKLEPLGRALRAEDYASLDHEAIALLGPSRT